MNRTQKLIAFAAMGIVAALAGALLARGVLRDQAPIALASGTLLQPPRATPAFALIDQNSVLFDSSRIDGHWTLMFFGFTNCGDVCPTTLTLLASVVKSVADLPAAQRPQVMFVSVDAKRDSPTVLKEYLRHFDPNFVGVTGAQSDLDAFTMALGVPSAIRQLESGYAVDHSASILVFNPQGKLRAIFSPPHTVEALASDYRALIGIKG
jgi:protein SCO1/2